MNLTSRRLDFIKAVKELYDHTQLPVHYVRVAEILGISKWSAYEMLKSLEKDGWLSSQYEVNGGGKRPGRAMILFSPTQLVGQLLNVAPAGVKATIQEWSDISDRLLGLLTDPEQAADCSLEDLAAELCATDSPLYCCAYVATILIAQVQNLRETGLGLIRPLVHETANTETGLAIFAGAATGILAGKAATEPAQAQLTGYLIDFQKNLTVLNPSEQGLLLEFLDQALAQAA